MNRRDFLSISAATALSSVVRAEIKPLGVAIIGHTGRGDYGHGLDVMWGEIPGTQVVAVADANPAGLAAAKKKLGGVEGFADYAKMLTQVKPGIVAVAPRHVDEHSAMILAAVEAGARGIYVEKPFCRSLEEADAIVAACERKNVKLAIAHRNRYHPVIPVIAQLVKDGAMGRLLEMRGRGKEDHRGGSQDLWVLGSHLLNLIHCFGGAPSACTATVFQSGRPLMRSDLKEGAEGIELLGGNEVHARFEMERGIPAFFDSVQTAGVPKAGFGLQLIGAEGIVDLRCDAKPLAHFLKGNPFQPTPEPRAWVPISTGGIGVPEPIADIAKLNAGHAIAGRDLVECIHANRAPLCSAGEGRVTIEMISAVFESHRLGGKRVGMPLQTRKNPLTLL